MIADGSLKRGRVESRAECRCVNSRPAGISRPPDYQQYTSIADAVIVTGCRRIPPALTTRRHQFRIHGVPGRRVSASLVRYALTPRPSDLLSSDSAGRRTLCGFHTYVGAVDMWVSRREGVGCAASRICTRD